MALQPHDIGALVRRFWEGDTTPEEESRLRQWFEHSDTVPEAWADLAAYLSVAAEPVVGLDAAFDQRLLEQTVHANAAGKVVSLAQRERQGFRWMPVMRVAAVAAVAIGVWFGIRTSGPPPEPVSAQSPEVREAFDQVKGAFMFMAGKLESGAVHTDKLDKINAATVRRTATTTEEKTP